MAFATELYTATLSILGRKACEIANLKFEEQSDQESDIYQEFID